MKTFHIDEPSEIGKKKLSVSSKELAMVRNKHWGPWDLKPPR